jgi:phosphoesterase RecJ-like protein
MNNEIIADILSEINDVQKIGLMAHKDGDGDAFGSMLGMARILAMLGKETVVFSNEPLTDILKFIDGDLNYQPTASYQPVDLLMLFDANSCGRFTLPTVIDQAKEAGIPIIAIDHHVPGDLPQNVKTYWNESSASCTSEMVFNLAESLNIKLDKTTATLLLLGIETDTLSLQFTNTKENTFIAVAELLKSGARLKNIVESVFGGQPIPVVKLLGRAIDRLVLDKKTGIGYTYVTLTDKDDLGLTDQASSGVANFLDQTEGVKIVVVIEERPQGIVKVSMRSNNSSADVAKIASYFGGGGHVKAAGFEAKMSIEEARAKILDTVFTNKLF